MLDVDVLRKGSQIGGLVEPVRLNTSLRNQITECIELEKAFTSQMGYDEFSSLMFAMNWLEHQLDKSVILFAELDLHLAAEVNGFVVKYRDAHPTAMQWVFNKINKRYSLSQIVAGK